MTACFGVLSEIFYAMKYQLFRKEIYATICILGGVIFYAQKIATERRCFVSQYITGYNFLFV
jgi:uncharacterized membrane protein YeiH